MPWQTAEVTLDSDTAALTVRCVEPVAAVGVWAGPAATGTRVLGSHRGGNVRTDGSVSPRPTARSALAPAARPPTGDGNTSPRPARLVAPTRRRLLVQRLVEETDALMGSVFARTPELAPQQHVTCPHCLMAARPQPVRMEHAHCVALVLSAAETFVCEGVRVPVALLGDDLTFGYVALLGPGAITLEATPFAAGGFGSIYRGTLAGPDSTSVALPVVAKELRAESVGEGFREFQHEVSLMAELTHPNIVRLFGIMLAPMRMIIEV